MPVLRKPVPSQVLCPTTLNFGGAFGLPPPPLPLDEGSPGVFAGAAALTLMWTLPSGATARMSLSDLFELNVIVCGPIRYQVPCPLTAILAVFGPNCVSDAS